MYLASFPVSPFHHFDRTIRILPGTSQDSLGAMKRAAGSPAGPGPSSKRARLASEVAPATIFDDEAQKTYVYDIRDGTDGTGFLQGKVHMVWSLPGKKQRILLETLESSVGGSLVKIDVYFQGNCADVLKQREVQFSVQDEILLALRGAKVQKKDPMASRASYTTMLKFSEGALFKFVRRKRDCHAIGVVDTWSVDEEAIAEEEDWFDPPISHTSTGVAVQEALPTIVPVNEDAVMIPPRDSVEPQIITIKSESPEPAIPPYVPEPVPQRPSTPKNDPRKVTTDTTSKPVSTSLPPNPSRVIASAETSTVDQPVQKLSKKERKKLRQLEHQQKLAQQAREKLEKGPPKAPEQDSAGAESSTSVQSLPQKPVVAVEKPKSPSPPSPPPPPTIRPPGPLDLKPGRKTRYVNFAPLKDVPPRGQCTVAGIVVSVTDIKTTRTGDFTCTLDIVDPSNCKLEDDSYRNISGMKVNCFTRKNTEWLPCPEPGDVVILKDVKVADWHGGVNLTGYADKLQWAIYSSKEQRMHHGDISGCPHAEQLGNGRGHMHSPFYHTQDVDVIHYCKQLYEWWHAIKKEQERFAASIIQIGGGDGSNMEPISYVKQARPHWLMKEVSPGGVANGYFDCTVEIVHKYQGDNDNYFTLFITDYTPNEGFEPFENAAVHPSLSQCVARLECWDAASKAAPLFSVGDFLSLKNVKCRVSGRGSYEFKMQEPKFHSLQEKDSEFNMAYADLIQRKKAHQDQHGSNDPAELEHRPLKDAEMTKFFSFVAEVVHINNADSAKASIYVTDYTFNDVLRGVRPGNRVSQNLEGRVAKLLLYDCNVEVGKQLKLGDTISVNKARIMKGYSDNEVNIRLAGNERLIKRLNPGVDTHKVLIEQLKRQKADWEVSSTVASTSTNHVTQGSRPPEPLTPKTPRLPEQDCEVTVNAPRKLLHHSPIKEVQAVESCPTKLFKLFKRVSSYLLHHNGHDADFLLSIPNLQAACFNCNDNDHEYLKLQYRFWLTLQDEHGTRLTCPILREFPRADLVYDTDAYDKVCELFKVLAGSTRTYEQRVKEEQDVLSGPLLCCVVDNARNRRNELIYRLIECALA
ncbi:hypothetical protein VNI00_012496 [Paramarasmius palmivorus]|uniref:Protection of telomeres protein 1 n=1 Tax=Paramarasmius palmivorus TaxID=297713 RepID=A0AAW0C606_9AGAR